MLQQKGARTNIVFSTDPVDGRGLLDILPSGISKVSPVREIAREFGLPDDRVVYAGDSGNDEAALLGGFRSIVVANALEGLKERLRRVAEDRGLGSHMYFADRAYAAGVLEGCREFGLI